MKPRKMIAAAVAFGTLFSISLPPAVAAPLMPAGASTGMAASAQPLTNVQYRRGYGHHRYHGYHGWRHRHGGTGAAVLGGLAAGAIIGGAIANSQARANEAAAYCAQRFRSYDPASGTYLGNDGYRHACP